VLWWIRGHSRQFKLFLANRIGEIQASISLDRWRYVPTKENPADYLTRGSTLVEILHLRAWWEGPGFLMDNQYTSKWPTINMVLNLDNTTELKRKCVIPQSQLQVHGLLHITTALMNEGLCT